jgi:iron complex outermembrane receptor protein
MHQTNVNSGEEYLIRMQQMILEFWNWKYEWGSNVCRQDCDLITDKLLLSKMVHRRRGYFKAVDRSFDSFNASLGTKLILLKMRLNSLWI